VLIRKELLDALSDTWAGRGRPRKTWFEFIKKRHCCWIEWWAGVRHNLVLPTWISTAL